jgi:hypothetical protein
MKEALMTQPVHWRDTVKVLQSDISALVRQIEGKELLISKALEEQARLRVELKAAKETARPKGDCARCLYYLRGKDQEVKPGEIIQAALGHDQRNLKSLKARQIGLGKRV